MTMKDDTHSRMKMSGTMTGPMGEIQMDTLMVSDGTHTWIEADVPMMGRQVIKMPVNAQMPGAPGGGGPMGGNDDPLAQIQKMADEFDFDVVDETAEEVTLSATVTAGQKGIPSGVNAVRLVFDKKTGFPRRMIMGGETPLVEMEFLGLQQLSDVDDSEFDYTPPEGVPVMDMSSMVGAGG